MLISKEMIVKAAKPYDRDMKMNYVTGKYTAFYPAVISIGHGEYCLVDVDERVKGHGYEPTFVGEVVETFFSKESALKALVRYYNIFDISY